VLKCVHKIRFLHLKYDQDWEYYDNLNTDLVKYNAALKIRHSFKKICYDMSPLFI